MSETRSNPFASPEIEDASHSEQARLQPTGAAHWVGLSALSGVLLFAGYLIAATSGGLIILVFVTSPEPWHALQVSKTAVVVWSLMGGIYGAILGLCVGIVFGTTSYRRRDHKPLRPLVFPGLPASMLFATAPLILVLVGMSPRASSRDLLATYGLCAGVGVAATMAAGHLIFNIRRFLVDVYRKQSETPQ